MSFVETTKLEEFLSFQGFRIHYGNEKGIDSDLRIPACGLLSEKGIKPGWKQHFLQSLSETLFPPGGNGEPAFDLFAAIFFLLSRYEEYENGKTDKHDRFRASESILHALELIRQPIVDRWANQLAERLEFDMDRKYRFLSTIDVDLPWYIRHKRGVFRIISALRNIRSPLRWWGTYRGVVDDPWDSLGQIRDWHVQLAVTPLVFFHLGGRSRWDRSATYSRKPYHKMVRQADDWADVGIHPSYYSMDDREIIRNEIGKMESILQRKVERSRQHYLRFRLPTTYRLLASSGIFSEYSMGYADSPGFRAGTGTPFLWYDILEERQTNMRIYTFQVMDGSLKKHLSMSPEEAFTLVVELINQCREYGCTFGLIWHNSSLSGIDGWAGWRELYQKILDEAAEN